MALEVEQVFFYPLENSEPHKTKNYEMVHDEEEPIPVLRRGLLFTMAIRFGNRGYDKNRDIVRLIFDYGPEPNTIKGTKSIVTVDPTNRHYVDDKQPLWFSNVVGSDTDSITLQVYSPPTIPVGLWNFQVETGAADTEKINLFEQGNYLYFLCNPWNCHDMVYMPEERLLDEYVLTDVGKIWVGPYGSSKGREWVFGQFDAFVLPAIMLMFNRSGLPHASRGDPIKLTRMISKMVNSNDDQGVLVGRWDGNYEDGTSPSAWTGSVPILEAFLETNEPVGYGQCWVFAGVVTTICRALGIPSRVVSNLVSAHDANASLSIDKYFDENNVELETDPKNDNGSTDSVWNYHVWNDVYMARPDLPPGYGGWQAIDATPQETSDGYYQCGPSSLEAIRKGNIGFNYDVSFMIASVNADLFRWKQDKTCDFGYSKIYCNKYHVGRFILTKKPFMYDPNGDKDRNDITLHYKAKEDSKAERLSLFNAVRGSEVAKRFYSYPDPGIEDMEFDLQDLDKIKIGQDFSIAVKVENKGDKPRHIKYILSVASVYYTGVKAKLIKKYENQCKVEPHSSQELKLPIHADEYLEKLVEYCNMKIYAIATVTETNQTWADEDDFQVLKPNLEIRVPAEILVRKPTTITLRFVNPLKKTLTGCKFRVSGLSHTRTIVALNPDARPEGVVKVNIDIVPKLLGEQKLVATFTSKELCDITGSAKVEVVA